MSQLHAALVAFVNAGMMLFASFDIALTSAQQFAVIGFVNAAYGLGALVVPYLRHRGGTEPQP